MAHRATDSASKRASDKPSAASQPVPHSDQTDDSTSTAINDSASSTATTTSVALGARLSTPTKTYYLNHYSPSFRARHKRPKSAASDTSTSTQPVLVRNYPESNPSAPHDHSGDAPIASIMTTTPSKQKSRAQQEMPPLESFSFAAILASIEPEVKDALDAIAEICARSKMSMASEHSAHMPPQGEIIVERGLARPPRHGLRATMVGMTRTLTAVPEASSSSERLAGGSTTSSRSGGSGGRKDSKDGRGGAYGTLRNLFTRSPPPTESVERLLSIHKSRHGLASWMILLEDKNAIAPFSKPAGVMSNLSPVLSSAGSVAMSRSAEVKTSIADMEDSAVASLKLLLRANARLQPR